MKSVQYLFLILILVLLGCNQRTDKKHGAIDERLEADTKQYITILGVAQDAGFPQINCEKECCNAFYSGEETKKLVSCLGLVDRTSNKKWLFDATPDIVEQVQVLKAKHLDNGKVIDGIFLTHAHIGHYTGLMQLGKEALGGRGIPVYAMPRMKSYIETNGPWSQLVSLKNVHLNLLRSDSVVDLNNYVKVTPMLVPHRDEYSETVGYKIQGQNKSALFIPDINKWEKWDRNIIDEVKKVDYAFLDASFFSDGELNRDMSQIPHPFIIETTTLFEGESMEIKNKIHFIHFNHTNPAIKYKHRLKDSIESLGFKFAKQGDNFQL